MLSRIAVAAALLAAALPAQNIKISSHTLDNGMKVLVHENHDVPNVAMYFFYRIGSRNEKPGSTGLSHFFEHMMFNGAKKYGPGQFDHEMEKAGGSNNAYTSQDVTVYTDWFPSTALELMFDMEADRIRDLAFDPKIIESERGVVYSERRTSVDNNPRGKLDEQMNAAAFVAHPYHWPVVGWPSDIESWTMDDLRAHFRMGYAPNNCVMVVTGDVTDAEIVALAKKHLEPIARQDPPPPVRTKEPEQQGEHRVKLTLPAQLPLLMMAWHSTAESDPDSRALDLLAMVLEAGRSSRLESLLVEKKQIALNVNAGNSGGLDPNLFEISVQLRKGIDPAAAEKEISDVLAAIAESGVTEAELSKARNQMLTRLFDQLKTIAGTANLLGSLEVFRGDAGLVNKLAAEFDNVTPTDVQRVTKKYLKPDNLTVATLIPAAAPASKEAAK